MTDGRLWVWQQDSAPAHMSKETQAWLQKESYDFVPFSHCLPPPSTWTSWTTSFGHSSRRSPTWPPTTPKPAWSPPSAEYSPKSGRCLWKRHAPSSGSVSRWWLRLKASTLNRCQLYFIIKLSDFFFNKGFKIKHLFSLGRQFYRSTLYISSSSSCRATSREIPDPLTPLLPIVHRFWQVYRATSRILT